MDHPALITTVEKLAKQGERAGLSTDQMIRILEAGFTVEDLIELLDCLRGDPVPFSSLPLN